MAEQRREPDPVLITDAARSYEEELAVRKRRYKIMMGMRIPCMILAAVFYQIPWLAVGLLVISIPLPWIAVLIANDRLPRKVERFDRYRPARGELEPRSYTVIDPQQDAPAVPEDVHVRPSGAPEGRAGGTDPHG